MKINFWNDHGNMKLRVSCKLNVKPFLSGRTHYIFFFFLWTFQGQNEKLKNCKQYQKYIYLGQNTSKYCSQIIVDQVHANGFL